MEVQRGEGKKESGEEERRGRHLKNELLYEDVDVQRRMVGGKEKIKWGSGVEVMTDVMCPFSSATRHLPEACGVFILLLDMLPSFSSV